jgi:hypothetical protein
MELIITVTHIIGLQVSPAFLLIYLKNMNKILCRLKKTAGSIDSSRQGASADFKTVTVWMYTESSEFVKPVSTDSNFVILGRRKVYSGFKPEKDIH